MLLKRVMIIDIKFEQCFSAAEDLFMTCFLVFLGLWTKLKLQYFSDCVKRCFFRVFSMDFRVIK